MICISLTGHSLSQNTTLLSRFRPYIDMAELRVDCLAHQYQHWDLIASWAHEVHAVYSIPLLLTIRNKNDGGAWEDSEQKREELLMKATKSDVFSWIDVEANLDTLPSHIYTLKDFSDALTHSHTQLVISTHTFEEADETRHGASWEEQMIAYADMWPQALIKTAIMCNSTATLCEFLIKCTTLQARIPHRFIAIPMGVFGIPGRILTAYTGSLWTYMSDGLAHLGQLNPRVLVEEYHYRSISKSTELYAIIGNPVMHSQSPAFHNKKFRALPASSPEKAYIPLPVDDCAQFPRLVTLLCLRGFSVTIPHKQTIIPYLTHMDEYVKICTSCNTVLVESDGSWHGYNTDLPGFLSPLYRQLARVDTSCSSEDASLEKYRFTIIGAGGTAYTIAYGLLTRNAHILIANRTLSKAQHLCEQLQEYAKRASISAHVQCAHIHDYEKISEFSDVIIQTTSVGLHAQNNTPLPDYPFTGKELIYEIIYAPAVTRLMQEAQQKGCVTIAGKEMFSAQAELQSILFTHTDETS